MISKKAVKLAGFAGALCASAALVATAASSTGAYFSDSHNGNLTGTSGHLQVVTTGTSINFSGINPGEDRTQEITYTPTTNSTTNEDVWIVFDAKSAAYGAFTGAADPTGEKYSGFTRGGLGAYGHFKVLSAQGLGFESYNLAYGADLAPCANTDSNGDGGSTAQEHVVNGVKTPAPYCGVPAAIKLGSNLAPGQASSATITFGLGPKTAAQDTVFANVPFKIVATQPGIRPNATDY
ncbi:MAG TPA: hypothetical protein VHO01_05870 [Jatrophihabitans sp.]|nr:hypothetical protein [Jatrophihabitans sp.]